MGAERVRGNRWAAAQPGWVLKLPASVTAGIPDWLHARAAGLRLVEAKTQEACARAGTPWRACSKAQQFILRMVERHAGVSCVAVLVLGVEGYLELPVASASQANWERKFIKEQQPYG